MDPLYHLAPAIQAALDITTTALAGAPQSERAPLLKKIIDRSDICVGVFKDPSAFLGWRTSIIKGEQLLKKYDEDGKGFKATLAAIPCGSLEEALALKLFVRKF